MADLKLYEDLTARTSQLVEKCLSFLSKRLKKDLNTRVDLDLLSSIKVGERSLGSQALLVPLNSEEIKIESWERMSKQTLREALEKNLNRDFELNSVGKHFYLSLHKIYNEREILKAKLDDLESLSLNNLRQNRQEIQQISKKALEEDEITERHFFEIRRLLDLAGREYTDKSQKILRDLKRERGL